MANNVNIVLERDVRGTSYDKYDIYVNNTKYVSGWIKPWDINKPYFQQYMSNKDILIKLKEMYYWLF